MSAAEALAAARTAGLDLRVDGQDRVLNAPARPPLAVLDLLARHKASVNAILRAGEENSPTDEWRDFYDERAAIAEFDGGLFQLDAEALAQACCVAEWLNRNPVCSSPRECLVRRGRPRGRAFGALQHGDNGPSLHTSPMLGRLARGQKARCFRRSRLNRIKERSDET